MPKIYDAIKRKMLEEGKSIKDAKEAAAKIYNSKHPGSPVYPGWDKKKKIKK